MSKEIMYGKCELAMMGKVVPTSNEEVQEMTKYIMKSLGKDADGLADILKDAICRFHDNQVKFLVCNTVMDMPCITYLLDSGVDKDSEDYYPAPFEEDYGTGYPCAFCYCFNLECDWCSEFGDCFFEQKEDGCYHRVS